jgi:secondary thiamine-phosphate synthase enzyme
MVKTKMIELSTRGNCHVVDITDYINRALGQSEIRQGIVVVFNVGSTGAITTTEFEPGLANYDLEAAFEKIAPQSDHYEHEKTWHDDNGHSHVRASLLGPSLTVPIVDGNMTLGTWQQVIHIDFDTRPRNRKIVCQFIGQ